ncbi:MAG: NAD-dependent protein deacetylase [Acidobacteriota bacterium]
MTPASSPEILALARFIGESSRLLVLTGAGCSTDSGIPDYRGRNGSLKRHTPVQFGEFMRREDVRRRYWARSYRGWPSFSSAEPNDAHHALCLLERRGRIHLLITQNVDNLHESAGSKKLVLLHGRNDRVICMDCGARSSREALQKDMAEKNPDAELSFTMLSPDGDADIDAASMDRFVVPGCAQCEGLLKPDVVFFGESVPRERVEYSMANVDESDGLLVVGSSLTVWSGYRFVRRAGEQGKPIAILNIGPTRADELAALKVDLGCGPALRGVSTILE